jgi:hypothetical protein
VAELFNLAPTKTGSPAPLSQCFSETGPRRAPTRATERVSVLGIVDFYGCSAIKGLLRSGMSSEQFGFEDMRTQSTSSPSRTE